MKPNTTTCTTSAPDLQALRSDLDRLLNLLNLHELRFVYRFVKSVAENH